jgi:TolB-like protein/Flp pilus assembly protein TadD
MRYLFDDCTLDPRRRELRRAGERVDLEPQVFDLLEYLIRTRDRVASRDDLLEAVWNGRIVSESTLSSRINAARVAVGDTGAAQRLIRTLPRKGVRFVGEVREEADAPAEPKPETHKPTSEAAHGPSIAVLPFASMSQDREDEIFADGISEEITTGLAQCSGLSVVARNSAFAFKNRAVDVRQIGAELGASYVLEGSVRRSDRLLRITAQLIDARSGAHLWADRFDGDRSDVLDFQDRITRNVVSIIEPKLLFEEAARARRDAGTDPGAYDLYLRALSLINEYTPEAAVAALAGLDQALEIAPGFAKALAASACYRGFCRFQGWTGLVKERPEETVRRAWDAVALAPNDPHVLWMCGFALWALGHDGRQARDLLRRSLNLNQNSEIALALAGWVEAAMGDPGAGRALIEQAMELNPTSPSPWIAPAGMAFACVVEGEYAEAVAWAERAVAQNHRFAMAGRTLVVALVRTGQTDRARAQVDDLLKIAPDATLGRLAATMPRLSEDVLRTYVSALQEAGLPP